MSLFGSLALAIRAVLLTPRWWLLSLAAFLVRGGVLLLFVPLVQLPTTAGLANALGPALVGFVFGGPSVAFITLASILVGAIALWLLGSSLIGAAIDLQLAREAARAARTGDADRVPHGGVWQALGLRWVAHVPTLAILVWGAAPLVSAGYAELIHPGDPALPVAWRVILRVPEVVIALISIWVLGEIIGGLAVRHLTLGAGMRAALAKAFRSVVRPSAVVILVLTSVLLAGSLIFGGLAVARAFDRVRSALLDGGAPFEVSLALAFLSASWLATLLLVSIAAAVRSVVWTVEVARLRRPRTDEGRAS